MAPLDESPEDVLDDESGSRSHGAYRYQSACAAFLSLDLLTADPIYTDLYCEHHDDIMMKRNDGTYSLIQVKTRGRAREKIKTSDEEVIKSVGHFIEVDNRYPAQFSEFILISNCGFWGESKTHDNLDHVISEFGQSGRRKAIPKKGALAKLMEGLGDSKAAMRIFGRLKPRELPRMESIELHIARRIRDSFNMGTRGFDSVGRAAKALINEMDLRSTAHKDAASNIYEILLENRQAEIEKAVIRDKQVTKQIVHQVVHQAIGPTSVLSPRAPVDPTHLPRGLPTMDRKMAQGGISMENIEHMLDCRYSAEMFFLSWAESDEDDAREYYNDILMRVRSLCLEAHDTAARPDGTYGTDMLQALRSRLKNASIIEQVPGDRQLELLLGVSGILTDSCKVWWSPSS